MRPDIGPKSPRCVGIPHPQVAHGRTHLAYARGLALFVEPQDQAESSRVVGGLPRARDADTITGHEALGGLSTVPLRSGASAFQAGCRGFGSRLPLHSALSLVIRWRRRDRRARSVCDTRADGADALPVGRIGRPPRHLARGLHAAQGQFDRGRDRPVPGRRLTAAGDSCCRAGPSRARVGIVLRRSRRRPAALDDRRTGAHADLGRQLWIGHRDPEGAGPAIDQLLAFTRDRLRWSLGGRDERPTWDAALDEAAITVSEAAITSCPDLPLAIGPDVISDMPFGWRDLDDDAVAANCASIRSRLERDIDEFQALYARAPRHQIEMETMMPFFVASDFHGVGPDADGNAVAVAVPGGACDGSAKEGAG